MKAFVLSIVVALALVGGYLLAGGGTYEPHRGRRPVRAAGAAAER